LRLRWRPASVRTKNCDIFRFGRAAVGYRKVSFLMRSKPFEVEVNHHLGALPVHVSFECSGGGCCGTGSGISSIPVSGVHPDCIPGIYRENEGPKARTKFERTMTALFRVPKSVITEKIKKKPKKGKDTGAREPRQPLRMPARRAALPAPAR
jgi:hypothetical protein